MNSSVLLSSAAFSSVFLLWKYSQRCCQTGNNYKSHSQKKEQKLSNQKVLATTPASTTTATKIFYLQLYIPQAGSRRNGMTVSIHNDFLIGKAIAALIKDDKTMLYIYLENKFHVPKQMILKYISEVYSRCWDEFVHQNKIKTPCIVSSDETSFQFLSKESFFQKQGENIIQAYLCEQSNLGRIPSEIIQVFPINYFENEQIFYFDDVITNDNGDDGDENGKDSMKQSSVQMSRPSFTPTYSKLAIGGTFDQLHNGHRKLLTLASALCSDELTIGILSDSLLSKKSHANLIQSFHERKECVESFMSYLKPSLRLNLVELLDPYGPTITEPSFQGIVVSSETLAGAQLINKLRQERGYQKLDILVIKRSDISTLSSTFLRERDEIEARMKK